jgi:hypothetical protein
VPSNFPLVDGLFDLLEAIDGDVAVELARDDDELAVRCDVHAVRTLGLGDQVKQALRNRLIHRDEVHPLFLLDLAGLDQLLGFLPIGHMQIIGVLRRATGLEGRTSALDPADIALGTERVGEAPAVAVLLARVGQVLTIGPELERE